MKVSWSFNIKLTIDYHLTKIFVTIDIEATTVVPLSFRVFSLPRVALASLPMLCFTLGCGYFVAPPLGGCFPPKRIVPSASRALIIAYHATMGKDEI